MNPVAYSNAAAASPTLVSAIPSLRGAKAAREFEATLVASLLQSMEKSFSDLPGGEGQAGADDYSYLGTQALADGIANHGGFGIAALIVRHLPETKVPEKPGISEFAGRR